MNSKNLPELDDRAFGRNQKTAWLLYLDKLTAWLWQDNDGAARWTLILDDVLRRVSINHPPRTAAGLKNQVNHQSRLKLALVHAFAPHYPTTISLHPNTEALDASGNIVPFGTNLLMNFLTGELFLPSRTANQYLVRYCGSRYATVKIVHRSEIHHKSSPPRIEPQSGKWMDHGETGRVARAVRTGRVARDRADRTG